MTPFVKYMLLVTGLIVLSLYAIDSLAAPTQVIAWKLLGGWTLGSVIGSLVRWALQETTV